MTQAKLADGWYRLCGDGHPSSPQMVWHNPGGPAEVAEYGDDPLDYRAVAWIYIENDTPTGIVFGDENESPVGKTGQRRLSWFLADFGLSLEDVRKRILGPANSEWEEDFEFV